MLRILIKWVYFTVESCAVLLQIIVRHRDLLWMMAKREVSSRYKGSYLGVLWSMFVPLLMLVIYTFVFGFIFKSRWSQPGVGENKLEFALILFCGLTTFSVFSEIVNKAPSLLSDNPNYVKKVVFPLEILPISSAIAAIINSLISFGIIFVGMLTILHHIPWTIIFLPVVLLPLVLFSLGISWALSSVGVYLRDISYVVSVAVTALMYLTPIFYPASSIPARFTKYLYLNPVSHVVDNVRNVVIFGVLPGWKLLTIGTLIGAITSLIGFMIFRKLRGGFADVL